jgi:hypothetical protein
MYSIHSTVQTLTYNVLKLFMEMDSQLFDQCSAQLEEREGKYVQAIFSIQKSYFYLCFF